MLKYETLSMEEVEAPAFNNEEVVANNDFLGDGNDALIQSLEKQIEEITQAMPDGFWGCKRCGKVMKKKQEEENTESAERQGKELSFVKAPLRPRQKKSNFVRKKRNKPKVVTVDRYRYENEDGSITWGYINDDGAFKVISQMVQQRVTFHFFRRRLLGWTV